MAVVSGAQGSAVAEDVQNLASNDEAEESTLAERVERIRGAVLLQTAVDGDPTARHGLVHLGQSEL